MASRRAVTRPDSTHELPLFRATDPVGEMVGEPPTADDSHTVHEGDNLAFMLAQPAGTFDLIYVDPPFFTGKRRETSGTDLAFSDAWGGGLDTFLAFLSPRFEQMHRLLKTSGTLYVHLDWRTVHYVKVMLDKIFGADNFLNEVIWAYRTGGRSRQWFARKHDTLLVYARRLGEHTFHVLRDGVFRTDGLNYDAQGRPYKSTRKGRLYFHPEGPAMADVWEIPFLSTVSLERTGYPTQKPEALLERIIQASSRPGDMVGDFFCGSGTTLVVAKRMGRSYLGCDQYPAAVELTRRRLAVTTAERISSGPT